MPLYDYECNSCGQVIEVEHAISADPIEVQYQIECPACGAEGPDIGFKRLITGSSFSLKGAGWSRDGYR